jgi:hypothetical protein
MFQTIYKSWQKLEPGGKFVFHVEETKENNIIEPSVMFINSIFKDSEYVNNYIYSKETGSLQVFVWEKTEKETNKKEHIEHFRNFYEELYEEVKHLADCNGEFKEFKEYKNFRIERVVLEYPKEISLPKLMNKSRIVKTESVGDGSIKYVFDSNNETVRLDNPNLEISTEQIFKTYNEKLQIKLERDTSDECTTIPSVRQLKILSKKDLIKEMENQRFAGIARSAPKDEIVGFLFNKFKTVPKLKKYTNQLHYVIKKFPDTVKENDSKEVSEVKLPEKQNEVESPKKKDMEKQIETTFSENNEVDESSIETILSNELFKSGYKKEENVIGDNFGRDGHSETSDRNIDESNESDGESVKENSKNGFNFMSANWGNYGRRDADDNTDESSSSDSSENKEQLEMSDEDLASGDEKSDFASILNNFSRLSF